MAAVEWIDALEDSTPASRRAAEERAAAILAHARPATPLHWLAAHRDCDFDGARRGIDLPPPRASWLGVATPFFKDMRPADLERVTAPAFGRLAALARRDGFPLVILTYLDFEKSVPSDCLRAFARTGGFPLVDLEAAYPLTELGADDKRRYFSSDRSHPNAAGYGLMARALLPRILELVERDHR
jgi:lysophospholipase L1-like esterase